MSTFGLTDDGYTAPREAELLQIIRDEYETRLIDLGLPADIDFQADVFLGAITAIMAARLGKLSEATQALYDGFDPSAATGLQLDNLSLLVGVVREEATASQSTVTYTGVVGTPVLQGDIVEGGGALDDQQWTVSADVVVGGGGTVDVVVVANDKGAVVAVIGEIDKIVSLRAGLVSVTNAADATTGNARETDTELRKRRQESLQISGGRNRNSLRAQLTALASVIAAAVVDNPTGDQVVVEGVILEAHSVAVIVHPGTLTDAQKEEVALVIYDQVADGIFTNGSDVIANVTGADGSLKVIRYDFADLIDVDVITTVQLAVGFELADVTDAVKAAVAAHFATLAVGDDVRQLPLLGAIDEVNGILGASVTLNGFTQDVTITLAQLANLDDNTVVV